MLHGSELQVANSVSVRVRNGAVRTVPKEWLHKCGAELRRVCLARVCVCVCPCVTWTDRREIQASSPDTCSTDEEK